jgi:hypothetical protein
VLAACCKSSVVVATKLPILSVTQFVPSYVLKYWFVSYAQNVLPGGVSAVGFESVERPT